MPKPLASLSLDLDNKWSYMKTHGDEGWETFPSFLDVVVPRVLRFLEDRQLKITFFVVGQDAVIEANQAVLRCIAEAGHEIGNHSFHHEPWLHLYNAAEIGEEIELAEQTLLAVTGKRPLGFRGPGFSVSPEVLEELARRGYQYDCSTFPTFLGPLARLYYFLSANLSHEERSTRKQLFGKLSEGFRPLRPYTWNTAAGPLVEIPVTTMPLFKLPVHVSYLLYLGQFSRTLARCYFRFALLLCRLFHVEISLLLHPLDFLGSDDHIGLDFFPGMNRRSDWKCSLVDEIVALLAKSSEIVPLCTHASAVQSRRAKSAIHESNPSRTPVSSAEQV